MRENEVTQMKYPEIERYMIEHNLSMKKFADMCRTTDTLICRFLNGKTDIRKSNIDKILAATGMNYEVCFREGEQLGRNKKEEHFEISRSQKQDRALDL
jgi:transcriptional regulator with XRE-family HTH domain